MVFKFLVEVRLIPAHAGSTTAQGDYMLLVAAHPRSRGEHSKIGDFPGAEKGSSPLTRGALYPITFADSGGGLIPAHAGSTQVFRMCCVTSRAHPRSRGEHALVVLRVEALVGSSPLTRGAPSVSMSSM